MPSLISPIVYLKFPIHPDWKNVASPLCASATNASSIVFRQQLVQWLSVLFAYSGCQIGSSPCQSFFCYFYLTDIAAKWLVLFTYLWKEIYVWPAFDPFLVPLLLPYLLLWVCFWKVRNSTGFNIFMARPLRFELGLQCLKIIKNISSNY